MDETTLRTLLDGALAGEPPIGPGADNALRAGIKARRRRVLSAVGSMAAAAAIAVAIPVVAGPLGAPPAGRQHPASTLPSNGSANVPPPDRSVLRWRAMARDRASIVKITGDATACNRSMQGTGFVISPQHVLTNAHVVAGMTIGPYVGHGTGTVLPARVVLFDWSTDVAILYVPGLNAPPLRFSGPAPQGSGAVLAGYPRNGAFQAVPARIGYDNGSVTVNIYAVRAAVKPGNSGGPLLAKSGKVYGVILSAGSGGRGFALAASAVEPVVRRGARATMPVSTHSCPRPG
jgi:S1-C subfamily serine protease